MSVVQYVSILHGNVLQTIIANTWIIDAVPTSIFLNPCNHYNYLRYCLYRRLHDADPRQTIVESIDCIAYFNQIRIRGLDKKIKNDTYNRGLIQCFLIYTSKMKDSNTSLTTMCPIWWTLRMQEHITLITSFSLFLSSQ